MISKLIKLMDFKPFRGKLRGEEDALAIQVAATLRAFTIEGRLKATWTCIPHEVGAVSAKSAGFNLAQARYAKAKAMGLIAGSGDYVFVWQGGGGWIELKSKTGSLSPDQQAFRDWAIHTGCHWAKCRSVPEVINTLREWGVLRD